MFQNIYELNIDIKFVTRNRLPIFVQGDTGGFRIKLFDDAVPFNLSQFTKLEVAFQSPTGVTTVDDGEINGDTLVYNFKGQELFENGDHRAIFTLYSGNYTVSTQPIAFVVQDDYRDKNTNYIQMLQGLIATVTALEASIEGKLQALDQAVTAEQQRNTNENGRVRAEDDRRSNEATRIINENARILAEQQRQANERRRMQTIDQFIFRGAYNRLLTYQPYNVVEYNGSSYVALKAVTNITPQNNGIDWRLVAQRGVDGSGAVASVNGILPDLNGNIAIPDATTELYEHANNRTPRQHVTFIDKNTTAFTDLGLVVLPVDNSSNLPTYDPNAYLQPRVEALENQTTQIDTDVQTLQADVLNNSNRINVLETELNTTNTDLTALEARVADGETHEATIDGRATALENDVTGLDGRVTALENETTSADGRLDAIEAQLAGGGTGPQLATTAEAQAGTDDTKFMSPLKTAQAIADDALLKTGGTVTGVLSVQNNTLRVGNSGGVYTDRRVSGTTVEETYNASVYQRVVSDRNVQFRDTDGTYFSVQDLKQSVVNGKNAVASAITDKGVPSNGNNTFDELATDIRAIQTSSGNSIVPVTNLSYAGGAVANVQVVAAYDDGTIWTRTNANSLTKGSATGGHLTMANNVGQVAGISPSGQSYYRVFATGPVDIDEYNFSGVEIASRRVGGGYQRPSGGTIRYAISKDNTVLHVFASGGSRYEAVNIATGQILASVNTNIVDTDDFYTLTVSDKTVLFYKPNDGTSSTGAFGNFLIVPSNPDRVNASSPKRWTVDARFAIPLLASRIDF